MFYVSNRDIPHLRIYRRKVLTRFAYKQLPSEHQTDEYFTEYDYDDVLNAIGRDYDIRFC